MELCLDDCVKFNLPLSRDLNWYESRQLGKKNDFIQTQEQ